MRRSDFCGVLIHSLYFTVQINYCYKSMTSISCWYYLLRIILFFCQWSSMKWADSTLSPLSMTKQTSQQRETIHQIHCLIFLLSHFFLTSFPRSFLPHWYSPSQHFFTSFGARDRSFMMIFRLWQNALLDKVRPPRPPFCQFVLLPGVTWLVVNILE